MLSAKQMDVLFALITRTESNLSEQQKEYWHNMSYEVGTPLQYGYYEGWEIIMCSFELLMFALLAVCIVPAAVPLYHAGDWQIYLLSLRRVGA